MKTFSQYIIGKLLRCRELTEIFNNLPKSDSNITAKTAKTAKGDIIAIGDIHGDIQLMLDTLLIGEVIEKTDSKNLDAIEIFRKDRKDLIEYYKWKGKNKIVVQVGDQIDRCRAVNTIESHCNKENATYDDEASDIEILLFFSELHLKALENGGAVYSLLGNHELMNIIGDIRYVSRANLEQLQIEDRKDKVDPEIITEIGIVNSVHSNINISENEQRRKNIFRPGGILAKFLGSTRYSILIVNGYLFVHGGVLDSFRKRYQSNKQDFDLLNKEIKKFMSDNKDLNQDFYNKMKKFIFETNYSPFTTRDLTDQTKDEKTTPCEHVAKIINHYGLKGIIIGHTPQIGGINSTCPDPNHNGKKTLFKIDVASSKAFYVSGNNLTEPQVLKINNNDITKVLKFINGVNNRDGILHTTI